MKMMTSYDEPGAPADTPVVEINVWPKGEDPLYKCIERIDRAIWEYARDETAE